MKISQITILPVPPRNGLLGFASLVVNESFYIGSVAIYSKKNGNGVRLVYPSKNEVQCVYPINKECGIAITNAVQKKCDNFFNDYYEKTEREKLYKGSK